MIFRIVICSKTLDIGQSRFAEYIMHLMKLPQNTQIPLLKAFGKN